MSTAGQLLREAQYAFQCISFGESRDNARNRRRASSISRKIIRKYPGTMEASEAYAILRRLGEESYGSNLAIRHQHISQQEHHKPADSMKVVENRTFVTDSDVDSATLNWLGLATWLFTLPRAVVGIIIVGGLFLFSVFGPLLFLPLIALVLFTGPLRSTMSSDKQREMNERIHRLNLFIENQRRGGST